MHCVREGVSVRRLQSWQERRGLLATGDAESEALVRSGKGRATAVEALLHIFRIEFLARGRIASVRIDLDTRPELVDERQMVRVRHLQRRGEVIKDCLFRKGPP